MRLKIVIFAALAILSLGLVACGGDGSDETTTETETATSEATTGTTTEDSAETTTDDSAESTTTESSPAPSGEAEGSERVEIVEFAYQPDPVVVRTGGKVIWQNEDSAPHTATADDDSFDTGTIEQGKLKSETFKQAGTFTYFCEIHPTMHGTVEVVEKD